DGITIANSGSIPLVSPFERYQTATPDTKSSGLGLSIVKSIADIYGLNIKYIHNGMHVFEVKTAFDSKIVADDI
ncbi:MAG: hypothetical protein LBD53_05400, partial [Tannerella sp.]|nr:hypothetical protein [Tannerella sp.]